MWRTAGALRLDALFFSLPYSLLWAEALSTRSVLAPPAAIAAHAILTLLAFHLATADDVARGRPLWLSPLASRFLIDRHLLRAATAPLLVVGALAVLFALLAAWQLGLAALAFAALTVLYASRPPRWRLPAVELLAPALLLFAPAVALRLAPELRLDADPPVAQFSRLPDAALAATCLGAVWLAAHALLCITRDEPHDDADGLASTATRLGRTGAGRFAFFWVVAIVLLASMGAGWGWWAWPVPAAAGLTGAFVAAALASHHYDRAVAACWTGHAVAAVALAWSIA